MSVLTVRGFTGGMTDFHIGADPKSYLLADNLVVDEYGNLVNRPGSALDFVTSAARAVVPSSASTRRIGLMAPQFTGTGKAFTILKQAGEKLHYDNGSAMTELVGPGSASAFDLSTPVTSQTAFSYASWNEHTFITHEDPFQKPVKIYRDSGGVLRLRTAGLPRTALTFTATGGSGQSYLYALVLKYTYTVGDVEYIDRGAPAIVEFTNIGTGTPGSSPGVTVGSIPVLANADGEHYDTSVIKVEVYRTKAGGTTLYYVGEVTNGTTSYADSTSDNTLETNITLYTSGGEVANTRPPKCKYVHATSDFCYYAHGIEVSTDSSDLELLPQRLYQSKRGDPDSVPASFFADMEEPITGISSVRSIPVVFCQNSIYRIDNFYDQFGKGGMIARKISDAVGGVGHLSIVQTVEGLYFAGNDGFYFTDGYRVTPLSDSFKTTYSDLVDTDLKRKRICGAYDIKERLVIWGTYNAESNETSDNARIFCLDMRTNKFSTWSSGYDGDGVELNTTGNISGTAVTNIPDTTGLLAGQRVIGPGFSQETYIASVDSSTAVTLSDAGPAGTGTAITFIENRPEAIFFRQFTPTALLFADRKMWMGQANGFTRYFDTMQASDPKIDESITGGAFTPEVLPVFWNYKGAAMDLGTTEFRKWVNGIVIKARPRFDITSEITIQPKGMNDDGGFSHDLTYVYFKTFYPWGSDEISYGDPRLYRRRQTIADVKRRFPAGKLRCEYKQLIMEPAFVDRYESESYAQATIAGAGVEKTVTVSGVTFPDDVKDYWIAFGDDSYTGIYRVLSRDSNTQITICDAQLELTAGANKDWVIRGYLKTALIQLIEYSVFYEILGSSQKPYQGENAVNS